MREISQHNLQDHISGYKFYGKYYYCNIIAAFEHLRTRIARMSHFWRKEKQFALNEINDVDKMRMLCSGYGLMKSTQ